MLEEADDGDRKKRIESACRVGAAFIRRRVLRRWRQFAADSRERRQAVGAAPVGLTDVPREGGGERDSVDEEEYFSDSGSDVDEATDSSIEQRHTEDDDDTEHTAGDAEELEKGDDAGQALLLMASAFFAWQQRTRATSFMNARVLATAWRTWRERAQQGALKELLRRRAARFSYLCALRRALSQFRSLLVTSRARRVSVGLQAWKVYTRVRRTKHSQHLLAVHHAQRQLMRRVLKLGFGSNVARSDAKWLALSRANELDRTRSLHAAFKAWRAFYESEIRRDRELQRLLNEWRASPSTHARREDHLRLLLTGWADYARSKSVARLVVANSRGRTHLRVLRECFDAWVAHVSRTRWQQITRERARTHLRRSTLRKCLVKWREHAVTLREARSQTRMALVHWKISVERRAFARWLAYLEQKREKRQRLHDALQFRHSQLVTHGVRQWLTAAMHLQEVRESHAAHVQAAHVARIWRRVASIARHWKLLTAQRRRKRLEGSCDQQWTGSVAFGGATNDETDWLARPQRQRLLPVESRAGKEAQLQGGGNGAWLGDGGNEYSLKTSASPLSEFVMLPRNRPQPRKPMELLLGQQQQHTTNEHDREGTRTRGSNGELEETMRDAGSDADTNAAMGRPREFVRYGFQFPVDIPRSKAATDTLGGGRGQVARRNQRKRAEARSYGDHVIGTLRGDNLLVPESVVSPTPMISKVGGAIPVMIRSDGDSDKYASLLDALEQQLLRLQTRKREWRAFQQRLADLHASHSTTESGVHGQLHSQQQQFQAQVLDMEREYQVRYRDWHDAQQRLRDVAAELAQLRQDLQLQVSS